MTTRTKIALSSNVLLQELDGEAVLLNLENEQYYGLDSVGLRFWKWVEEYADYEKVLAQALENYRVDEATLRQDLNVLLAELADAKLITLIN